jgi:CBS-domain-containing membrane protein
LEKAQLEFDYKHTQYHHRAVLILDKNKKVVGKLSQFDVLKALEQKSEKAEQIDDIARFGFSDEFVTSLKKKHRCTSSIPLDEICITAGSRKVEDFMQAPTEGEYIDENAPLNAAVNQIVSGGLFSLLVTKKDKIVGILRLTDVFAAVFHVMKESEL